MNEIGIFSGGKSKLNKQKCPFEDPKKDKHTVLSITVDNYQPFVCHTCEAVKSVNFLRVPPAKNCDITDVLTTAVESQEISNCHM